MNLYLEVIGGAVAALVLCGFVGYWIGLYTRGVKAAKEVMDASTGSYLRGKTDGYNEGHSKGHTEGWVVGYANGADEVRPIAYAKGFAEAKAEDMPAHDAKGKFTSKHKA